MTSEALPVDPAPPHPAVAPIVGALDAEIDAAELYLTELRRVRLEAHDLGRSIEQLGRPDDTERIRALIGDRILVPTGGESNGHAPELPPPDDEAPPPVDPPEARGRRKPSSSTSNGKAPARPPRKPRDRDELEPLVRKALMGERLTIGGIMRCTDTNTGTREEGTIREIIAGLCEEKQVREDGKIRSGIAYRWIWPDDAAASAPLPGAFLTDAAAAAPSAPADEEFVDPGLKSDLEAAAGIDPDADPDAPQGISWPQPGETSLSNLRSRVVHLLKVTGPMRLADIAVGVEFGPQDVADCVRALLRDEDVARTNAGLYEYVG